VESATRAGRGGLTVSVSTAETPPKSRPVRGQFPYVEIEKVVDNLKAAAARGDHVESQRLADGYVALVIVYAQGQLDVSKTFFLPTVFSVLASIERKYPIQSDARQQLARQLARSLEEAATLSALVEGFKGVVQHLSAIRKAMQGPNAVRIEATLHYLRNNFTERLRLREVARVAGFSPPAFVRIFREKTGTSFLPFVRALRVECAKDLLATSKMTLEQIAGRTGFRTTQNLIRSFRRVTGRAPREFRAHDRTQGMTTPGQPKIARSDLFRPLLAMSQ